MLVRSEPAQGVQVLRRPHCGQARLALGGSHPFVSYLDVCPGN